MKGKSTLRGNLGLRAGTLAEAADSAKSPAKKPVKEELAAAKKSTPKKTSAPTSPASKKRKAEDEPAAPVRETNARYFFSDFFWRALSAFLCLFLSTTVAPSRLLCFFNTLWNCL